MNDRINRLDGGWRELAHKQAVRRHNRQIRNERKQERIRKLTDLALTLAVSVTGTACLMFLLFWLT
jgi:hypothetical protein